MLKKFLFLFFIFLPLVSAASISPSKILIDDLFLGETSFGYFFVVSDGTEKTFSINSTCAEIVVQDKIIVKNRKKVDFKVLIKEDKLENFDCSIFVEELNSNKGLSLSNTAKLDIILKTTNQKNINSKIYKVEAFISEENQDIPIIVGLQNFGNTKLDPVLNFKISNKEQSINFGSISPKEKFQKLFKLNPLHPGVHNAELVLTQNNLILDKSYFNLTILRVDQNFGKVTIENVNITHGKLTKFEVTVKNHAPAIQNSKLNIELYKKGKFIKVLQSNQTYVKDTSKLTVYDKLNRGSYTADVKVIYNNKESDIVKKSFKIGRSLNPTGFVVNSIGQENATFLLILLIIILVFVSKNYVKKLFKSKPI